MNATRVDPREHYYIARCENCPLWLHACNKAPMKAHNLARKHARRCPEHKTVVINLTKLEVVHTYQFDAFEDDSDPNGVPF